jgi:hypothetical protein
MCIKARRPTTIARGFVRVSWRAPVRSLRIESFENESAVVAEQLVHTHHPEEKDGVVIIALNPFTLASWTLHTVHHNRVREPIVPEIGLSKNESAAQVIVGVEVELIAGDD